jgi:hypothetical protein
VKLVNPTDDQLNAAFAEKVAGYFSNPVFKPQHSWCRKSPTGEIVVLDGLGALPPFTRSMDAVLPWLEQCLSARCENLIGGWNVKICYRGELTPSNPLGHCYSEAMNRVLPRAAVIALLRAHGVEVELTP